MGQRILQLGGDFDTLLHYYTRELTSTWLSCYLFTTICTRSPCDATKNLFEYQLLHYQSKRKMIRLWMLSNHMANN